MIELEVEAVETVEAMDPATTPAVARTRWQQHYQARKAAGLCYLCPAEKDGGPSKPGPTYKLVCDPCGVARLERQRVYERNRAGRAGSAEGGRFVEDPVGRLIRALRLDEED